MIPGRIGIRTTHKHHLTYKCSWFCSCIGFSCHLTALQFLFAPELWQALISLHNRRFASQVRRTRHFARSSRRARFFYSPLVSRLSLVSRKMPRSPLLAYKAPVVQANFTTLQFLFAPELWQALISGAALLSFLSVRDWWNAFFLTICKPQLILSAKNCLTHKWRKTNEI